MQYVMGYSPLGAGLRQLPAAAGMILVAPRSAAIADRVGRHRAVAIGLGTAAVAVLAMVTFDADTSYLPLGFVLLAMGLGMGLAMPPATDAVVSSLPLAKAGVGSAINDTTRQVGGALGVAIIGSVVSSLYAASVAPLADDFGLDATAADKAESSLGQAQNVAGSLGDGAGAFVTDVNQVFTDAMTTGMLISAVIIIGAAVMAWRYLPARAVDPDPTPDTRPEPITIPDTVEGALAPVAGD
jgi:hypothetical protein